jgi:hypothetical protein
MTIFLYYLRGCIVSDLHEFAERLPEQAVLFTARIGTKQDLSIIFKGVLASAIEQGYKPSDKDTLETYSYENLYDLVEDCLVTCEDEGFGIEHPKLRFQAYTIDRKPIRSKVLTKSLEIGTENDISSIQALTHALIRMSEEVRRTLKETNVNNSEHLKTISHLVQSTVQAEKEKLSLERENMAKELIMQLHDDDNGDDTRQQGLNLLERVVSGVFQQQAGNIDDMIKETIKNDPEKVREFMKDPEVVASIMREVMKDDEEP